MGKRDQNEIEDRDVEPSKGYRVVEKIIQDLPELKDDQGPGQIGKAITAAHRSEVKLTRLLTVGTRRLSVLKRRYRGWFKTWRLKVRNEVANEDNIELQFKDVDGVSKRRTKEERQILAEATFAEEKDAVDDLFDEGEAIGMYVDILKTNLQTVKHYREDVNKYLKALDHMKELGEKPWME